MNYHLEATAAACDRQRKGKWPFAELTPQQRRAVQQMLDAQRAGTLPKWPAGLLKDAR